MRLSLYLLYLFSESYFPSLPWIPTPPHPEYYNSHVLFGLAIEVLPDKQRPHRHSQVPIDVGDTELPAGRDLLSAVQQAVELILNPLKSINVGVAVSFTIYL